MTDDLDRARRRFDVAEDRLETSRERYLGVLAAARKDFEEARAERAAAWQNLQATAARIRQVTS
jgi:hypothetical protein